MIIAGIDEAGRGSVLGPLALAIVCLDSKKEESLLDLGVKDSKELSKEVREALAEEIKRIADFYAFTLVEPPELNRLMERFSLNEIEAMKIAELLNSLEEKPEVVIVDAPDPVASSFAERIRKYLPFNIKINAEHFADKKYAIVSAASIIAKVERDKAIEELSEKFGQLGSGYWHDERTQNFLNKWVEKYKKLPEFARAHWEPSKRLMKFVNQRKLEEFL